MIRIKQQLSASVLSASVRMKIKIKYYNNFLQWKIEQIDNF